MPVENNNFREKNNFIIFVAILIAAFSFGLSASSWTAYEDITDHYCYKNSDGIDFCEKYTNENIVITGYNGEYNKSFYPENCNCDTCVNSFDCDCDTVMCSLIGKYNYNNTDTYCSVYDIVNDVEKYYWTKSSLTKYIIGSRHNFYKTHDIDYKCYEKDTIDKNGLFKYQFMVIGTTFTILFLATMYLSVYLIMKYFSPDITPSEETFEGIELNCSNPKITRSNEILKGLELNCSNPKITDNGIRHLNYHTLYTFSNMNGSNKELGHDRCPSASTQLPNANVYNREEDDNLLNV